MFVLPDDVVLNHISERGFVHTGDWSRVEDTYAKLIGIQGKIDTKFRLFKEAAFLTIIREPFEHMLSWWVFRLHNLLEMLLKCTHVVVVLKNSFFLN